jgi:hypothetical protein
MPAGPDYPLMVETDRMIEASKRLNTQAIGEFLEWASEHGMRLCSLDDRASHWWPVSLPIERLLAQYIEIDMDKVETERRALLEHVRRINGEGS